MHVSRTVPLLALGLLTATAAVGGQEPAPVTRDVAGATIRGSVIDSLARAPLAGATVQLVAVAASTLPTRSTASDSAGHFAFADVPDGIYLVGFLHPLLDSLGLEPIVRSVSVSGQRDIRVELAVPGPASLRRAYCGAQADGGAVVGFVRTAEGGAPAPGASVVGTWRELAIGGGTITGRMARRVSVTEAGGGFVLCDLPSPGTVRVVASRGPLDTDPIEVDIPGDGLLRRDLYLGEARPPVRHDATVRSEAPSTSAPPPRTGAGSLHGVVTAADGGGPLADVQVRIVDGEPTRTTALGQWTLTGVPSGTRMLEARMPGYLPVRRAVDVIGAARPVHIVLSRLSAVLDTLRIVAPARSNLAWGRFEDRRSAGMGRFLDAAEVERLPLLQTSDIFTYVPGLIPDTGDSLLMRSAFGDACTPVVVINGHLMQGLSRSDVNSMVSPREIAGIEIYRESQVPPQFQIGLSGCGSIVLWTK